MRYAWNKTGSRWERETHFGDDGYGLVTRMSNGDEWRIEVSNFSTSDEEHPQYQDDYFVSMESAQEAAEGWYEEQNAHALRMEKELDEVDPQEELRSKFRKLSKY